MTLYILNNDVNELNEVNEFGCVVHNKPKVFTNYDDAFASMETDYNSIVHIGDTQESCLGDIDAYIIHKDGRYEYYRIWEVDV